MREKYESVTFLTFLAVEKADDVCVHLIIYDNENYFLFSFHEIRPNMIFLFSEWQSAGICGGLAVLYRSIIVGEDDE